MPVPKINRVDENTLPQVKVNFPLSKPKDRKGKGIDFSGKNPFNFAPIRYEVEYGKKIYLSDIYNYNDYPVIFAYVSDGTQLQPRLFYFSKSHALWRVAPAVSGKFGKAYEEFSCDLPPLLNMALTKTFQEKLSDPSLWRSFDNLNHFVNAFTEPIPGEFEEHTKSFEDQCAISKNPLFKITEHTFGYLSPDPKIDLTESVLDPDSLPDFSTLETMASNNSFYAEHLIEGELRLNTCVSYNGKYRYLFADGIEKNTKDKITFLLTMAPEPPMTNSYAVASEMVNLGYKTVPPLIRPGNMLTQMVLKFNKDYFPVDHHDERYSKLDLGYIRDLPINQLLQNPERIEQLRIQIKNKNAYPDLIQNLKSYIINNTWHIKGLFDYSEICLAKGGDPNKLPKHIKNQWALIKAYEKNKDADPAEVFKQIKKEALVALSEDKKQEAKPEEKPRRHPNTSAYYHMYEKSDEEIMEHFANPQIPLKSKP